MCEPLSAIAGVVDVAIKSANAAYQHVRTVKTNKVTLQLLVQRYNALRSSLGSMAGGPTLDTQVWRDALAGMHQYFSSAVVELDALSGTRRRDNARRVVVPREVEGILNGLLLRLRHVELLVVNLDGFANVRYLVGDLVVENCESLRVQGAGIFARLDQIERLIQSQPPGLEAITLNNDVINQLLREVEKIGENQRAGTSAADAQSFSRQAAMSAVGSSIGSNNSLLRSGSGAALDQDAITTRYAQVDPKIGNFINAVQKGCMAPADKDRVVQSIRQLLEPWKVDPARVRYNLRKEIGAGGYGRVYRGRFDNDAVAVKVVTPDLVAGDESLKADFLREASLMLEMRHPCIVEFLGAYWPDDDHLRRGSTTVNGLADLDISDDEESSSSRSTSGRGGAEFHGQDQADPSRAFILSELMSCNLHIARSMGYLQNVSDIRQGLCDVAEALHYMHSMGVVHMDVKAENVLVRIDKATGRLDGRVKLADFGISTKKRDTMSALRSRTGGKARGTRLFMAPELLRGKCSAQKACDVWSFGALMCSVLSEGSCPLVGWSDLQLEQAAAAHTLHKEVHLWARSIENGRLQSLALRCLSDEPSNRPSLAGVFGVLEWSDDEVMRVVTQAACLYWGTGGVDKNETKAAELYRRASDAGDTGAMKNLGVCYENGTGLAKDEAMAVEMYRRAADDSDADGMVHLGVCYRHGRGVPKDEIKAVELYKRAADAGNAYGMVNLGACYEKGNGVPIDHSKAAEQYRRAADAGSGIGMRNLGVCHQRGTGVAKDEAKAVALYRRAADVGDVIAIYNLGVCYECGTGVAKDDANAVTQYRRAANAGYAMGMQNLGVCYEHGKGVTKNETKAFKLFMRAADAGDVNGTLHLGVCYEYGRGVTKNESKAVELYRSAADAGNSVGMKNLGVCFEHGRGVVKDVAEAVELYRRAAAAGDADGMVRLGVCYEKGRGVAKDEVKAVGLYRSAANAGDADGMVHLGVCYRTGRGVSKDEAKAVELYRRAAHAGNAYGMVNLGICYERGRGLAKDEAKAAEQYRHAADSGYATGMYNLGVCYEYGRGVAKDEAKSARLYKSAVDAGYAGDISTQDVRRESRGQRRSAKK
jgi:TPR repeat protein/serine/threonine protein kinase